MKTEFYNGQEYVRLTDGGVDALYRLFPVSPAKDLQAVLVDLDGTTLDSERFWVRMIELSMRAFRADFTLAPEDTAHVVGYTTREHLRYCIQKYGLPVSEGEADSIYHTVVERELANIKRNKDAGAFPIRRGLPVFLTELKRRGLKIGLVTSGLLYKAEAELASLEAQLGQPLSKVYDAVITGGVRKTCGRYGTLGELAAKPHPWLYAEIAASLNVTDGRAVVVEDSASGAIAGRLAGFPVFGFSDGTVFSGGVGDWVIKVDTFDDILRFLR